MGNRSSEVRFEQSDCGSRDCLATAGSSKDTDEPMTSRRSAQADAEEGWQMHCSLWLSGHSKFPEAWTLETVALKHSW